MNNLLRQKIINIVNDVLTDANLTTNQVDENLQKTGMNSIEFIRIVVLLEVEFELEIPDEILLITEMNTINKMCNVIDVTKESMK